MTDKTRQNTWILIAGDVAIFMMFALIGRETHATADPNLLLNAQPTLLSFLASWFLVAMPLGVFRPTVYRFIPLTIIRTLATWIVAGPIGLLARAWLLNRPAIPLPFVVVTMGLNGVLLLAWHVFIAWWLKRTGR